MALPGVALGATEAPTAEEVTSYRKDFGVGAAAAEERLEVQHRGATIIAALEEAEGDAYAGVWFDNASGEFVVPLADEEVRGEAEAAVATLGLGNSYRIVPASYSWEDLEETQQEANRELQPMAAKLLVQTSVDPRTNSVVVTQAQATTGAQRDTVEGLEENDAIEVRESGTDRFRNEPASCYEGNKSCTGPMRGGVRIDNGTNRCTTAFIASSPYTGQRFVLTAGHCPASSPSATWQAYWGEVGTVEPLGTPAAWSYPTHDWAAINANGSFWDTGEWVPETVLWGIEEERPINYEASSYVGEVVCHSGQSSGTSCGTVTEVNKTITYVTGATLEHMTHAQGPSLCTIPGDSGGPVIAANVALGIVSGGPVGETCPTGGLWYTEITEATSAMGVSVAQRLAPGNSWHSEETSGEFLDRPGISQSGANNLNVFVRGLDGNLWQKWTTGAGWGAWQYLGGPIWSGPSAWSDGTGVGVYARVPGNAVGLWNWNGSSWSSGGIGAGEILGEPGTAANHVFVRGLNNLLYQKWWTGSAWTEWQYLGGGAIASSPSAAAVGSSELVVVARMTNNHVGVWSWTGSTWLFQELTGEILGDPAVAWAGEPGNPGAKNVNVFAQGLDGNLWQDWTLGVGWSGWQQLTATPIKSSPAAVGGGAYGAPGRVTVVARNASNNVGIWRYGP